jgi:hypothetical protein
MSRLWDYGSARFFQFGVISCVFFGCPICGFFSEAFVPWEVTRGYKVKPAGSVRPTTPDQVRRPTLHLSPREERNESECATAVVDGETTTPLSSQLRGGAAAWGFLAGDLAFCSRFFR